MLERQRTQGRRELRHWRKLEQLRCPSIEDSAGRHSWVAPGYYHLVAIWFLGTEPQGRSSGSHPTRPQSSRSWSCTCWQGEYMHHWEGWGCLKPLEKSPVAGERLLRTRGESEGDERVGGRCGLLAAHTRLRSWIKFTNLPWKFFDYPSANRSGQRDNPEIQFDNDYIVIKV